VSRPGMPLMVVLAMACTTGLGMSMSNPYGDDIYPTPRERRPLPLRLPSAPSAPKPLTKRQKRRLRGKGK
jgi:hypothetical protein